MKMAALARDFTQTFQHLVWLHSSSRVLRNKQTPLGHVLTLQIALLIILYHVQQLEHIDFA